MVGGRWARAGYARPFFNGWGFPHLAPLQAWAPLVYNMGPNSANHCLLTQAARGRLASSPKHLPHAALTRPAMREYDGLGIALVAEQRKEVDLVLVTLVLDGRLVGRERCDLGLDGAPGVSLARAAAADVTVAAHLLARGDVPVKSPPLLNHICHPIMVSPEMMRPIGVIPSPSPRSGVREAMAEVGDSSVRDVGVELGYWESRFVRESVE